MKDDLSTFAALVSLSSSLPSIRRAPRWPDDAPGAGVRVHLERIVPLLEIGKVDRHEDRPRAAVTFGEWRLERTPGAAVEAVHDGIFAECPSVVRDRGRLGVGEVDPRELKRDRVTTIVESDEASLLAFQPSVPNW